MQTSGLQFAQRPAHAEPPQYAEFEASKPRNDDALPEMPSWEGSNSKKVSIHQDAVELDSLSKPAVSGQRMGAMSNSPLTQLSPYSQPQGNPSGYLGHSHQPQDTYSPIDQGYGYNNTPGGDSYRADQAYGAAAIGAGAMGAGVAQAHSGYGQNQGYGQDRGYGQPQAAREEYGNYGSHGGGSSPAPQDYGMGQPPNARRPPVPQNDFDGYGQDRRTPAPQVEYENYGQISRQNEYDDYGQARRSPAPQNDYAYNQPSNGQRMHSPAPEAHYGPRPVPQRQYPQQDSPKLSTNNNSDFDFSSGFARPQQPPTQESYAGYRPYQA